MLIKDNNNPNNSFYCMHICYSVEVLYYTGEEDYYSVEVLYYAGKDNYYAVNGNYYAILTLILAYEKEYLQIKQVCFLGIKE